jgi:hypothetical protein
MQKYGYKSGFLPFNDSNHGHTQLQCQVFPLFINVIRVLQVNIIKSGHWKRFETYGEHHD